MKERSFEGQLILITRVYSVKLAKRNSTANENPE